MANHGFNRARHTTFNYRRHETQGTHPAIRLQPRLVSQTVKINGETQSRLVNEPRMNRIGDPEPVKWISSADADGCPDRSKLVYAEPRNDGSFQAVDFKLGLPKAVKTVFEHRGKRSFETDGPQSENELRSLAGLAPVKKDAPKTAKVTWQPFHEKLCADGLIRPCGSKGLKDSWESAESERRKALAWHGFTARE